MADVVANVFQLYVPPPFAVKVVLSPEQMDTAPIIVGVGIGFTVTVCVAVPLHIPLDTVTL